MAHVSTCAGSCYTRKSSVTDRTAKKKLDTIALRIPPATHDELRAEAVAACESVSAIVREGIDLALEKRKKERDQQR